MKRRDFLQVSFVGMTSLGLAGCGFRLRGVDTPLLGLERVRLEAAGSDLAVAVREALENADTRLDDDAPLRLNLGRERFEEFSLTHGDAGSQDIEVQLTAPFSVQRVVDSAYLLDQQQLETSTTVTVSNDDLLARDDLLAEAREQLRRDAARQLLERLRPLAERHQ